MQLTVRHDGFVIVCFVAFTSVRVYFASVVVTPHVLLSVLQLQVLTMSWRTPHWHPSTL